MKQIRLLNIIFGWIVFAIAGAVYLFTIEPSASLWDCGEFIAASYKLQVGHPPGAPLFLLIGRVFTLFAGTNTANIALMVNAVSALASAFTVLFLFWSISHFSKKMVGPKDNYTTGEKIAIIGSAWVGSLSFAFTDTFWFSAVEGEVYALSSLFTSIVFWAILKWENVADKSHANRWIILIAYLIGLSIGVHLLNLLAIPAIILIYYFKKYTPAIKGVLVVITVSTGIMGGLMYGIIPGFIYSATLFERFFINILRFPYWTGAIVFMILLTTILVLGLYFTYRKRKILLNTIILGVMVICLGYSSYATILIRSNANPPMDQNNPENVFNLLSYINREQYGDRPLIYGQNFNAPVKEIKKKKSIYAPENNRYDSVSYQQKVIFESKYSTLFPRMWSNSPNHRSLYLHWSNLNREDYYLARLNPDSSLMRDEKGRIVFDHNQPKANPGLFANLKFFFNYQLNHMYFRYFMWNFSGRQNDFQAHYNYEITNGNWITGLNIVDEQRLGNQSEMPRKFEENKARNRYFMIPFVLGLFGFIFQLQQAKRDFWVIGILFLFTGVAIVLYLNQTPLQPRERDYAYVGSFYAFSIWIGLSIIGIFKISREGLRKHVNKYHLGSVLIISLCLITDILINKNLSITPSVLFSVALFYFLGALSYLIGRYIHSGSLAAVLIVLTGLSSPVVLAIENWDDHDRSNRYFARDIAINYLNSCEKNGIIFTMGDNDTFPLWFVQEVEGIRKDVRIVNLSYLNASWYIEQMERKIYSSQPLPFSLTYEKYKHDKREIVYLIELVNSAISIRDAIDFVAHDEPEYKTIPWTERKVDFIPQNKFFIPAEKKKAIENGTLHPINGDKFTSTVPFQINSHSIRKNQLMIMDLLATNDWERPIYFAITVPDDYYLNLSDYFEMAGLTYRIVPAEIKDDFYVFGGINPVLAYERLMNDFEYRNVGDSTLFYDNTSKGMLLNLRNNMIITAAKLNSAGMRTESLTLLDKVQQHFPDQVFPYDLITLSMAENYDKLGATGKSIKVIDKLYRNMKIELEYYTSLNERYRNLQKNKINYALHTLSETAKLLDETGQKQQARQMADELEMYSKKLMN